MNVPAPGVYAKGPNLNYSFLVLTDIDEGAPPAIIFCQHIQSISVPSQYDHAPLGTGSGLMMRDGDIFFVKESPAEILEMLMAFDK